MAKFGEVTIWLSLAVAVTAAILFIYGLKTKNGKVIKAGHISIWILFILSSTASLILLRAFLVRDFSILYVFSYSSRDLPLLYTITAFWGGQEGSLLLWQLLLSLFTLIFLLANRKGRLTQYALAILVIAQSFFLLLLALPANPFETAPMFLADGIGLNPLLLHPQMVFHPPALFIGYAAFTVPFALSAAALITNQPDGPWVSRCRRWTLFAWLFLGIGIFLGSLWAYDELAFGGYWAWDPVENASLLPWLTGTALLHSLAVYKKRKLFKIWTLILAMVTFLMCILGTFITRSGIIESVHAFGRSSIAVYFFWFMILFTLGFIFLVIYRRKSFKGEEIHSLISKDYGFYLNNIVLLFFTAIVTIGTFYPVITELLIGNQISLGPSFYNKLASPLGYIYLFFIGICPLLGWKTTDTSRFIKKITLPSILSLVGALATFFFWDKNLWGSIGFFFCIFAGTTTLQVTYRELLAGMKHGGNLWHKMKANRVRYGGLLSHIGIVIIFVGLIGSTFYLTESEATLKKGESLTVKDATVTNEGLFVDNSDFSKEIIGVNLALKADGEHKGRLSPKLIYHLKQDTMTSKVNIKSGVTRDIFVILSSYDQDESARIQFKLIPLMSWIWMGAIVLFAGTVIAFWPDKSKVWLKEVK
ncbi:cytochrome c-type biogenesis CcmF C-terminal domain-containing protein [Candidatus Oleimmundimicrobium sp.]|uniref:heme lyase CcmF/NrfE family subunit n=1 Tax=Candidatus Oleimmundimicrobium sp. TaxID=3060597 RepID=UPI00271C7AB4|nr:cytochrome c-type biogenesis CcmF C-terminal domain-containing protein [Candidatus Oleimmundimicrobium sp.]MDO8886880.1 cytochrome c-type biogenesis CcmF C-terminal domain-containing protein [Candidatus Oleimmundimicrobium sp.]